MDHRCSIKPRTTDGTEESFYGFGTECFLNYNTKSLIHKRSSCGAGAALPVNALGCLHPVSVCLGLSPGSARTPAPCCAPPRRRL